jgi:23S rRNA (guanosine2251-2'-O)-methyltransferase
MAGPKSEILFGFHPVLEALRAGRRPFETLMVRRGRQDARMASLGQLAERKGIALRPVEEQQLSDMIGHTGHQGVCARVGPLPYCGLTDILTPAVPRTGPPFVVLLDSLQDPHNLGAVIRSAYCAGVDGIVIPQDRASAPTPWVSKASAGAMEHMPLARVPNLVNALGFLKRNGLWLVGLDGAAEQSLFASDLKLPLGLVVGGEERGLRPLVKRHCDYLVSIPHARAFNSLNASVAAALAIFEAFRQRSASHGNA